MFPYSEGIYQFTDFYIEACETAIKTDFNFYERKYEDRSLILSPDDYPFCTITIPPFCTGKAKLGVFLKEFSILLDEMLVKWDKNVVQRLYTETMQALFPDEVANYELGFYEIRGFLYCTIQFSEKGHRKVFGKGRNGSTTADDASKVFKPPLRVKFQATDPAMEEFREILESRSGRRPGHQRRKNTLVDFDFEEGLK